jgi:hypothetical protein
MIRRYTMNQDEHLDLSSVTQREDLIKSPSTFQEEENSIKKPPRKLPKITLQKFLVELIPSQIEKCPIINFVSDKGILKTYIMKKKAI